MSHAAGRGESNDLPFMKGTYRVPFLGSFLRDECHSTVRHTVNANLAHKWIRLQMQKSTVLQPGFTLTHVAGGSKFACSIIKYLR